MKNNKHHLKGIGAVTIYPGTNVPAETNSRMNRRKVYWICQLTGWSVFALVNIFFSLTFGYSSWQKTVEIAYQSFVGISLTHIFKDIIKKNNWLNLPLKNVVPRILGTNILIGMLMSFIFFMFNSGINSHHFFNFKTSLFLVDAFRTTSTFLLWTLIYFSVHYFENYRQVQIESLIWEAAVKDFELKTLKSQLNPHFMFNALNSIRALIEIDPSNAQTAVTKLSNILRYSLKMERVETVPLGEEMQAVSDYLALESVRFEERLRYKIEIDPKTISIEIPPMMIQTLVENGIKHGISKITDGGCINIKTELINSSLHIMIKNSGQINNFEFIHATGFGISNTKHRLHLLYGEKASFSINNESKNEVLAELVIPTGGTKNESFNN
ncbi:MAG: histidine kinase [Ignavibacteriaceae bacterium]|nr:histidine kinase [Ignavibacteriaceae bacterium]